MPPSEMIPNPSSPFELSIEYHVSPAGTRTPSITSLKWEIIVSIDPIASPFGGRTIR